MVNQANGSNGLVLLISHELHAKECRVQHEKIVIGINLLCIKILF